MMRISIEDLKNVTIGALVVLLFGMTLIAGGLAYTLLTYVPNAEIQFPKLFQAAHGQGEEEGGEQDQLPTTTPGSEEEIGFVIANATQDRNETAAILEALGYEMTFFMYDFHGDLAVVAAPPPTTAAGQQNTTTTTSILIEKTTDPKEYEVKEIVEAMGWNLTAFEPLNNGTILVNVTRLG